jgi:glucose/mannose-6-phosphate isomerase
MADMKTLIEQFPAQLEEAMAIGSAATITRAKSKIRNVVVTGLGGSGIGGNLVSELVAQQLKVPMLVNKDYHLPAFVDKSTLVIVSSYSGNTEETLSAMQMAFNKGAKIVCVSSGGKTIDFAKANGLDYIQIPGGNPPRSCLGYSSVQQLFILYKLKLIKKSFQRELKTAIKLLTRKQNAIKAEAEKVAKKLQDRIPIIYTVAEYESVAVRFRQQLNENSKMLCWHHVVPEMNHNELVGWRKESSDWAVVYLRNETDYERNQKRIEINKEVINNYTNNIIEIWSKGKSKIERTYYLIHITDWISLYLSEMNAVDIMDIKVIDHLKNALAKV